MTLTEKIAITCVSLSWLIFAGVFVLPFVVDEHEGTLVAGATYVVSQVAFWSGCAIGGRAMIRRFHLLGFLKRWLLR